jgi:uncharacterized membrane protein YqiK
VININAEAERKRQIAVGEGKAAATESVGKAEANAIRAKAEALTGEGARMQLINDLGQTVRRCVCAKARSPSCRRSHSVRDGGNALIDAGSVGQRLYGGQA